MKLVVIIPAFNEEATIARVIRGVPTRIPQITDLEVVVVDDGSSDRTAYIARETGATVISHQKNRGVGSAFWTGIEYALSSGGDVVVNIDADEQFDPGHIPELIAPILENRADFVTTTRFADPELVPRMPWVKKWGNRRITGLVNRLIGGTHFTDVSCGFRAYSREAAFQFNLFGGFTYTQESFIDLAYKHVRMTEVSLPVRGMREHGKSRVANNLFRYAVNTSMIMLRAVRDIKPLAFFGTLGLIILGLGFMAGAFVLIHWLLTGHTSPYRSLLIGSAVGLLMGFLLIVLALIADMLGRQRRILEEILLRLRKHTLDMFSFREGKGES
ncbi:MAG TPA: glycosyltransferase [bacterium]|nr:glycosyltransferase [bacterium]